MEGVPMTASYDGRLVVAPRSIGACCRRMDEAAMRRQVYVSQKGVLMLRNLDEAKGRLSTGSPMVCCPYCGAKVNGIGLAQGGAIPMDMGRAIVTGGPKGASE